MLLPCDGTAAICSRVSYATVARLLINSCRLPGQRARCGVDARNVRVGYAPLSIDARPDLCLATEQAFVVADELGGHDREFGAHHQHLHVAQSAVVADMRGTAPPLGDCSRAVLDLTDTEAHDAWVVPEPRVECAVILRDERRLVLEEAAPDVVRNRLFVPDQARMVPAPFCVLVVFYTYLHV